MSESPQLDHSDPALDAAISIPPVALLDRIARIRAIRAQMLILRREYRTLTGDMNLRELLQPVDCLRCGYTWTPNSPFTLPATCARCGSTAWMKPPTRHSRKPGDPPKPYWKGRRQARKGGPVAKLRIRLTREETPTLTRRERKRLAATTPFEVLLAEAAPPMTPPPAIESVIPPPPGPSLYDHLRRQSMEEPQPEMVTSRPASSALTENDVRELVDDPPGWKDLKDEYPEPASVTSVDREAVYLNNIEVSIAPIFDDVPPEQVGQPQSDAEREELEKARTEAWPTTRPDD